MLYEKIIHLLRLRNWKYQVEKENSSLLLGVSANYGNIDCYITTDDRKGFFSCISFCHCYIFAEKYNDVIEFISLANLGLNSGSFEFESETGRLRFKTTFYYDEIVPSQKILEKYILTNLYTLDLYTPALMSLVYSEISAKQAIAEVEEMTKSGLN